MENEFITGLILPLSLAIIMLGMGASLVVDDFKNVLRYPKAVGIGVFGQIILLPLVGYLFALQFGLSPEFSVGIMVLVACAGGATSNIIVYMAKGDVALSVSLTAISSLLTVISIPFVVNFALAEFMSLEEISLPIGTTNMKLFVITLLPVLMGMTIRHYFSEFTMRIEKPLNKLAGIFFILIVVSIFYQERAQIATAITSAGPVTYALNFITMLLGFIFARILKLNEKQSVAISVEIGVQNSATAIFIATALLHNSEIAIIPAIYSLVMYINSGLLIGLMHWHMKSKLELEIQS